MDDPNESRQIAKNWREYVSQIRESFRVFGWVWKELIGAESKRRSRRMLALTVMDTLFAMAQPWFVKRVVDGLSAKNADAVVTGLLGFFACLLMMIFFRRLYARRREVILGDNLGTTDRRVSELFFEKSLGQHLKDNNVLSVGNMERGRGRVQNVQDRLLFDGLPDLFDLTIAFVCLWIVSPVIGGVMAALLVNYLAWALYLNRRCIEVCTPIDVEFRKLNRHRVERWDKVERVKTCGKEAEEVGFMDDWFRRILSKDRPFWLWFIDRVNLRSAIDITVLTAVMGFAAWKTWNGLWTIGMFFPILTWSRMFTDKLWRIGQIEQQLNFSMPSVKAMKDALTMPPDIADRPDAVDLPADVIPRVEFRALGHAYAGVSLEDEDERAGNGSAPRRPVLSGVSFAVEPGEKVALIGSSGAGKTTVMRLLQRYMDPEKGSVAVDDRDLREYRLDSWRAALGYIAQQPQVLDGTIRSNLLYGLTPDERERATDDQLWELMRRLQIDFGDRLTDGLDTRVGRNGIKLSGGEAQRLLIGAAAMRHPRFMVIDEATSSLDSTTEKQVQRGLAEVLSGDMSALIIAHRLSTVRHLCSKFVVLKNGDDLAEGESQVEAVAGSFEELYRLSPTFRRLADDQEIAIAAAADAA